MKQGCLFLGEGRGATLGPALSCPHFCHLCWELPLPVWTSGFSRDTLGPPVYSQASANSRPRVHSTQCEPNPSSSSPDPTALLSSRRPPCSARGWSQRIPSPASAELTCSAWVTDTHSQWTPGPTPPQPGPRVSGRPRTVRGSARATSGTRGPRTALWGAGRALRSQYICSANTEQQQCPPEGHWGTFSSQTRDGNTGEGCTQRYQGGETSRAGAHHTH